MKRIAEFVTKLEDAGVEIIEIKYLEDGHLFIDGTPMEKMVEVFKNIGWKD